MLDHQSDRADDHDQDQDGNDASGAAFTFAGRIAIEPSVKRVDQAADPCDRMADRLYQSIRVAETKLDQHGDES